ncbi:8347_t:CDS:1, partial [Funneliformis geosporum]
NCCNKNNEKFILNIYIDKENFKKEIKEKIVQMLEEPPINLSEKVKLNVSIGLNSKDYPGIQLADIVANGLQRGHKKTDSPREFRNVFEGDYWDKNSCGKNMKNKQEKKTKSQRVRKRIKG